MKDVIAIAIVLGFFALAAGYVAWCERIVAGDAPDRIHADHPDADASPDRAAADDRALSGARS